MGKLLGSMCILSGCLLLLICWTTAMRQKQKRMREFVGFLQGWEYVLTAKKMGVIDFLETYSFADPLLEEIIRNVHKKLTLREEPDGTIVWRKIFGTMRRPLGFPVEAYEVCIRAGDSFFGTNMKEAKQCAQACIRQMEQCIVEEQRLDAGKRRVYMPVGMLAGVMLVILLI